MPGDRGYRFVVAAAVAALLTAAVLVCVPLGSGGSAEAVAHDVPPGTSQPVEVERQTLIEADGSGAVARVLMPLALLVAFPLLVPSGAAARSVRGVSAGLLLLGSFLAILSIGVLVLPTAILMLIATWMTEPAGSPGQGARRS